MTAFINHFSFEFRTGIRNRTLLMLNYLFPLGFYLLMGLIMAEINPAFKGTMLPAMVVFAIMAATMLGLPDPLVTAREDGIYRSYKINGVPAFSILVIPALTTILHMVVVSAIITITAPLAFETPSIVHWPGLGVLIGVISSSSRMTVLWSQIVFLPSMLLGGMMVPYDMLPEAAGKFSQLLPATQAMNAFRAYALDLPADFNAMGSLLVLFASGVISLAAYALDLPADFNAMGSLLVLFTSGVISLALAVYLFNWDRRNTTQRGHPLMALLVLVPYVVGVFVQ
jgi:ABC-2 type transport system permease protein